MAYISQLPNDVITLDGDLWVIDLNENHILNGFYTNTHEITGNIASDGQGGSDPVAKTGDTITVPIEGGDYIGEYIGPVVISTANVTIGIPSVAEFNIKLNDVNGHVMRGQDGNVYLITDQELDNDHLGASVSFNILGYDIELIDVPLSELNSYIANELDELGDRLGTLAGIPFHVAADVMRSAADLSQSVLDVVVINLAESTETLPVDIVCFVKGTLIMTENGYVPIEHLSVGDKVCTLNSGTREILWIGSRTLNVMDMYSNQNTVPIRIEKGSLGNNIPSSDLLVSPQHRILIRSEIAKKMFCCDEVLIAAKHLLPVNGVDVATDMVKAEYFHILLDRHEVIYANGAESETLFTGPEAMKAVGLDARQEILAIFPEIADSGYTAKSSYHIPSGRTAKMLISRHIKNTKPLVKKHLKKTLLLT